MCSIKRHETVWNSMKRHDTVWNSIISVISYSMKQYENSMKWVIAYSMKRHDTSWNSMKRVIAYCMQQYETVWNEWFHTVWNSTKRVMSLTCMCGDVLDMKQVMSDTCRICRLLHTHICVVFYTCSSFVHVLHRSLLYISFCFTNVAHVCVLHT